MVDNGDELARIVQAHWLNCGAVRPNGQDSTRQILIALLRRDDYVPCVVLDQLDRHVAKALHIIEQQHGRHLSLGVIAKDINLSRYQLAHLFKTQLGVSIGEFLQSFRLAFAMRALSYTDERISQICYGLGMSDLSNFDHMFRRCLGCSPTDFRRFIRSQVESSVTRPSRIARSTNK